MVRKDENTDYKLSSLRSFASVADVLRRSRNIEEIWMVMEGGSSSKTYVHDNEVYNVFSFSDFNEVIELLKPDLVMGFGGNYEYLERSMIKAAQSRGVPCVTILGSFIEPWVVSNKNAQGIVSGRLHALRDHGKNIIRRYFFMLKTLFHAGYGFKYIFYTIIRDAYLPFTSYSPIYKFGGADLNIISTPTWANRIIKNGVDRNKIVVTGDCSMDCIHKKLENTSIGTYNKKENLEILFITSPMVEHGYWKPNMRKEVVHTVVSGILGQLGDKVNLRLKIHPKTERLDVYKELLSSISPSIEIIQTGDLLDLISDSDIIVSFGTSSALFQALLLNKPIFIMNIFNEDINKNIYLKENVAIECKTIESLVRNIDSMKIGELTRKNLGAFIEKTYYKFDGKCSERAAEAIISLLVKSQT